METGETRAITVTTETVEAGSKAGGAMVAETAAVAETVVGEAIKSGRARPMLMRS